MVENRKKKREKKLDEAKTSKLKQEVARELGLSDDIASRGWANLTSRETGKIGGLMAKRLREKRNAPG